MNRSIKVLSIAVYYFFPSLKQFSNSISKKWLVFGGDPIFDFYERSELAASFGTTRNQKEQCPENTTGAVKHPIWAFQIFIYDFSNMRPSVVMKKNNFIFAFGHFSCNARLKRINCSRLYWSPIMESPGFSSS